MSISIIGINIKILCIILTLLGMFEDVQTRKFKNWTLLLIIIGGVILSVLENHAASSLTAFLLLNVLGVVISSANIIGAADCKVLSCTVLFFDVLDSLELQRFLLLLGLCVILFIIISLLRENGLNHQKWKDHFTLENMYFKELVVFKRFKAQNEQDLQTLKAETVPFTIPIGLALILYLFTTFRGVLL